MLCQLEIKSRNLALINKLKGNYLLVRLKAKKVKTREQRFILKFVVNQINNGLHCLKGS